MSPATSEILFEFLNFGLLAAGLGWLLFRPVRAALDAEGARLRAEEEGDRRAPAPDRGGGG